MIKINSHQKAIGIRLKTSTYPYNASNKTINVIAHLNRKRKNKHYALGRSHAKNKQNSCLPYQKFTSHFVSNDAVEKVFSLLFCFYYRDINWDDAEKREGGVQKRTCYFFRFVQTWCAVKCRNAAPVEVMRYDIRDARIQLLANNFSLFYVVLFFCDA